MGCTPVVLNIGGPGNIVPVAVVLNAQFLVALRQTEKVVRETISRVGRRFTAKAECALRGPEQILNLLIDGPAPAKAKLVRSLRPGNVVTDLVVVRSEERRVGKEWRTRLRR